MNNYLLAPLHEYFNEIMPISGRIYVVSGSLPGWQQYISKEHSNPNQFLSGSVILYRDLSKLPNMDNLEVPNYHFNVTLDILKDEVENLVSRYCGLAVQQAYEVFEVFFIRILSAYFINNKDKLLEFKFPSDLMNPSESAIEIWVKRQRGKNNKGLIEIMKSISPYFKDRESSNYLQVNILHWFDLISAVRHTLVHERQIMSKGLIDYLDKHKANKSNEFFDRQFARKKIDGKEYIFLTSDKTSDALTWLNSLAHFIFKSLSVELSLAADMPRYIPPPLWSR